MRVDRSTCTISGADAYHHCLERLGLTSDQVIEDTPASLAAPKWCEQMIIHIFSDRNHGDVT